MFKFKVNTYKLHINATFVCKVNNAHLSRFRDIIFLVRYTQHHCSENRCCHNLQKYKINHLSKFILVTWSMTPPAVLR